MTHGNLKRHGQPLGLGQVNPAMWEAPDGGSQLSDGHMRAGDDAPVMRAVAEQLDRVYGDAIRALYSAMKARGPVSEHITGYWHENRQGLPDWEQEFDRKYADMFEVIIGVARSHGMNPREYLNVFYEACNLRGGKAPENLERFLPWNMSAQELGRLSVDSPDTIS